MNTVRDLLARKGSDVWCVDSDATVFEALWLMEEHGIGSVLVMDSDRLAGILTDRDYSRKVLLTGHPPKTTLVTAVMASPVHTIHPDQSCEDALAIMTSHYVRHLPVVEDGMVVGIISMRDVVAEIIYQQRETIRFWEDLTLER